MFVTADTITDSQIRGLRRAAAHFLFPIIALTCTVALGEDEGSTPDERLTARERCADAYNAQVLTDTQIRDFMATAKRERSTPGHELYDVALGLFGPGADLSACADALNVHLDSELRSRARAHVAKAIAKREEATPRLPIGSDVEWTDPLGFGITCKLLRYGRDDKGIYAEVTHGDGATLRLRPSQLRAVKAPALTSEELDELETRLKPWDDDSPLASLARRALAELRELRAFDLTKGGMCPLCQGVWGAANCPGRAHRDHAEVTCEGNCCTSCGGPIDDEEGCRCPS